jgi:hypothetical protein
MSSSEPPTLSLSRRELLQAGGSVVAAAALPILGPESAAAQTPKRGGTLRLTFQADPLHFDPHQTLSFVTMVPLSLIYSRLMKVKAGPVRQAHDLSGRARPRRIVDATERHDVRLQAEEGRALAQQAAGERPRAHRRRREIYL